MITENQSKAVNDMKSQSSIFPPYERHGPTVGILLQNDYVTIRPEKILPAKSHSLYFGDT